MKYWETIANRLMKAGWSLGWVSTINSNGQTIWIVDAHRDDGKRFVVHAEEKLTALHELELPRQEGEIFPKLPGYENNNTATSHGTHVLRSGGCRT